MLKPVLSGERDQNLLFHQHRYHNFSFISSSVMSRFNSPPLINVDSSPLGVDSGLRSRFNTIVTQPETVSGDFHSPAVSVAFGGESLGR